MPENDDKDIWDDERVDKELRRWQDAIRDKLIQMGAPDSEIDGAGCDSGDPLDFTLAEIGQGVGYFIDQLEELRAATTPTAATSTDYSEGFDDAARVSRVLSDVAATSEVIRAAAEEIVAELDRRALLHDSNATCPIDADTKARIASVVETVLKERV